MFVGLLSITLLTYYTNYACKTQPSLHSAGSSF
jgi:hypothetical protein